MAELVSPWQGIPDLSLHLPGFRVSSPVEEGSPSLLPCCHKHREQRQLGKESVYFGLQGIALQEGSQSRSSGWVLKQKPKEECFFPACLLLLAELHFCCSPGPLVLDDTAHNGRGPPTSASNQESAPLTNLMHEIPQLRFPLPENVYVYVKLTKTNQHEAHQVPCNTISNQRWFISL